MGREPQAAQLAQEDDDEVQGVEGPDNGGQEGQEGADEAEGAALDTGEEQETGGDEDVVGEPPSRGETRFQRLSNENAELRRRLTDLERRPTQPVQPQFQEESEEQFQARIQMLPPDERMEQRQLRQERRFNATVARMQFQTQVSQDKVAFDAKATVDPRFKRYAGEVEAKHAELLSQGQLVPREAILKFIIGEKVLANQDSKEAGKQRQRSAQNVQRQQARPTGSRSDVQSARGRVSEAEARRRRLENAEL